METRAVESPAETMAPPPSSAVDPRRRPASSGRRFGLLLAVLVALGLVLRLLFATTWAVPLGVFAGDERYYQRLGANLADGKGYTYDIGVAPHPDADHPPLYPVLLAGLDKLGLDSDEGQRVGLAVLGAGTIVLIAFAGRRVGGDAVGLVTAALTAFHPLWVQLGPNLWPDGLYIFLLSGLLLAGLRLLDRPTVVRAAVVGIVVGLAALTRSEALGFLVFLFVPLALVLRVAWSRRLVLFTVMVAGTVLVVSPWLIRNRAEFGVWNMTLTEGAALSGANCDSVYSGDGIGAYDFGCWLVAARDATVADPSIKSTDAHSIVALNAGEQHVAVQYAKDHAGRLPVVAVARVGRGWSVFASGDELERNVTQNRNRTFQTIGQYVHWLLLPFVVVGAIVLFRTSRRRQLVVLATGIVYFTVYSAFFVGDVRYRILADPALAVLAAVGLLAAARWIVRRPSTASEARPAEVAAAAGPTTNPG